MMSGLYVSGRVATLSTNLIKNPDTGTDFPFKSVAGCCCYVSFIFVAVRIMHLTLHSHDGRMMVQLFRLPAHLANIYTLYFCALIELFAASVCFDASCCHTYFTYGCYTSISASSATMPSATSAVLVVGSSHSLYMG